MLCKESRFVTYITECSGIVEKSLRSKVQTDMKFIAIMLFCRFKSETYSVGILYIKYGCEIMKNI